MEWFNRNKVMVIMLGIILILGVWLVNTSNRIITNEETVKSSWSDVEAQYQRRMNLIPNLEATVKGYAKYEKEVLMGITEARSKVGSVTISAENLNAETMKKFQEAQSQIGGAISRLLAVSERYPDLKSSEVFIGLMAELEGAENRIAVATMKFNEAVKIYNSSARKFPGSLFGYERMESFKADAGAEKVHQIGF